MSLSTTSDPDAEPLTTAEAKDYLRLTHDTEDTEIADMIKAARHTVEARTRLRLITQTVRLTLNAFPTHIQIPVWPVQSIDSITYLNSSGVSTELDAADYQLITSCKPNEIAPAYLLSWPTTRADYDAVSVDLIVGYGAARSDIPYGIRRANLLLIADFYEYRENTIVGANVSEAVFGVNGLLSPHVFWV